MDPIHVEMVTPKFPAGDSSSPKCRISRRPLSCQGIDAIRNEIGKAKKQENDLIDYTLGKRLLILGCPGIKVALPHTFPVVKAK